MTPIEIAKIKSEIRYLKKLVGYGPAVSKSGLYQAEFDEEHAKTLVKLARLEELEREAI